MLPATASAARHGADRATGWVLLLAACGVLFLTGLPGTALRGRYDDVDRALIARNMSDSGDWLVANYLGEPLLTKPPLMYWTAAALYRLTGRHDELPAQLASVLGMIVAVLGTWWFARRLWDGTTALIAGLLLATFHLFLDMARQPLIDTVMMAGVGLMLAGIAEAAWGPPHRRTAGWLVVAVGLAWGWMTKGPVIVPVAALVVLPAVIGRPPARPRPRTALAALALLLLLTVPWHVVLLAARPDALAVWQREFLGRFGDGAAFHAWTQQPWWFYLADLPSALPWLPLLPAGLILAWRRRHDRRARLLLVWAVGGFAFFSLASATKRSYYLLPLYPAYALLIATAVREALRPRADRDPRLPCGWLLGGAVATTAVAVAVALAAVVVAARRFPGVDGRALLLLGVPALAAALAATSWLGRRRWRGWAGWLLAAVGLLQLAYHTAIVPPVNAYLSGRPFYAEARAFLSPDRPLLLCRVPLSLSSFYLETQAWHEVQPDRLAAVVRAGGGGLLVTRPRYVEGLPDLQPLVVRTVRSPFGDARDWALYRLPD